MAARKLGRTCSICKEFMEGSEPDFKKHGEDNHPDYVMQKNFKFSLKKYYNPLIDKWFSIRTHLARSVKDLGYTNERYYNEFGEEWMPDEWKENTTDPTLGDGRNHNKCLQCEKIVPFDEGHWCYNAFCSFPCSTTWYAQNTNRVERAMETNTQKKKEDPYHNLQPVQVDYWIVRHGMSYDDAVEKVKERQRTNSLEAFIKRADGDVEEGKKKHAERQEKWLNSLNQNENYKGFSDVSTELFENLRDKTGINLLFGKNEKTVRCDDMFYKLDCCDSSTNKFIEFYGNYWHGNPSMYTEDFVIRGNKKYTVGEKWELDRIRMESLKKKGYDALVVWEADYRKNPDDVLQRCIEFMTKRK